MTVHSQQLTAPYRPPRRAAYVAVLIVAFAAGMIAGAIAVRAMEGSLASAQRPPSTTTMVPFAGVATPAAEYRAVRTADGWLPAAPDTSMSAAARAAFFTLWLRGKTGTTMSDAARAAWLEEWFRGEDGAP